MTLVFSAVIIITVVLVFVAHAHVMQTGVRRFLAAYFNKQVEREKIINPGLSRQTILEALVYEQRVTYGTLTKAEADYVLKKVRYE